MNDKSQLMNPPPPQMNPPPPQMMNQSLPIQLPPPQMMNQPPSQVMKSVQSQIMSQPQSLGQPQAINHPVLGMSQPQGMNLSQSQGLMNQPHVMNLSQSQGLMNQPLLMNKRNFNPNPNTSKKYQNPSFLSQPNSFPQGSRPPKMNRSNWKGKKVAMDNRLMRDPIRRPDNPMRDTVIPVGPGGAGGYNPQQIPSGVPVGPVGTVGYKPPTLNELQSQNRMRARKFYPKKKFNNRYVPYAPRNTSSFIIRAKKSGGIAEMVSPYPVTPAVLPTPIFSPSREVLGDMAKEEWGVDGYGSMKGLIRLRSDGNDLELHDEDEEEEAGSSESDVEEHVEVEKRLNHDLSRFEMIYPNYGGFDYNNVLENRVDDQDHHIAQLEEENLTLKERFFLMERELSDLRGRLLFLERQNRVAVDVNEEVVENGSENDSETGGSDARGSVDSKEDNHHVEAEEDDCMEDAARVINTTSMQEDTETKSVDAQVIRSEDKVVGKEDKMKMGDDGMVAEKQFNESKYESTMMVDGCVGNEKISQKQNDEPGFEKAAQNDLVEDEK